MRTRTRWENNGMKILNSSRTAFAISALFCDQSNRPLTALDS